MFSFFQKKDKFSIKHFKQMHQQLQQFKFATKSQRAAAVDILKQISELMVYGEKHAETFFDFFCEVNMMDLFWDILQADCGVEVQIQIIQTVSILMQNIRQATWLYYMLSNNHVNNLITARIDSDSEELMAYYISFLKTLSLQLNVETLQFFFNQRAPTNKFPLYSEAIKYYRHENRMVRIAVRAITLSVYKIRHKEMHAHLLSGKQGSYINNVVWHLGQDSHAFDRALRRVRVESVSIVEEQLRELLDTMYYLQDVFETEVPMLSEELMNAIRAHILRGVILPAIRKSRRARVSVESAASVISRSSFGGRHQQQLPLDPMFAMFLLAQIFSVFQHKQMLNLFAADLMEPRIHMRRPLTTPLRSVPDSPHSLVRSEGTPRHRDTPSTPSRTLYGSVTTLDLDDHGRSMSVASEADFTSIGSASVAGAGRGRGSSLVSYKDLMLRALYGEDQRRSMGAMCVLYAMLQSPDVDPSVLGSANLSRKCNRKARKLIGTLTSLAAATSSDSQQESRLFAGASAPTAVEPLRPTATSIGSASAGDNNVVSLGDTAGGGEAFLERLAAEHSQVTLDSHDEVTHAAHHTPSSIWVDSDARGAGDEEGNTTDAAAEDSAAADTAVEPTSSPQEDVESPGDAASVSSNAQASLGSADSVPGDDLPSVDQPAAAGSNGSGDEGSHRSAASSPAVSLADVGVITEPSSVASGSQSGGSQVDPDQEAGEAEGSDEPDIAASNSGGDSSPALATGDAGAEADGDSSTGQTDDAAAGTQSDDKSEAMEPAALALGAGFEGSATSSPGRAHHMYKAGDEDDEDDESKLASLPYSSPDDYSSEVVDALLTFVSHQPPPRLCGQIVACHLLKVLCWDASVADRNCLSEDHTADLKKAIDTCRDQISIAIGYPDPIGGLDAVMFIVEQAAHGVRHARHVTGIVSSPKLLLPLTRNIHAGIPLEYRLPAQRMEVLQVQTQAFLLLRRLRALLCLGGSDSEESTVETLLPPSPPLDRGDEFKLSDQAWLSATIIESQGHSAGGRAIVLGRQFLVIADSESPSASATATVRVTIPLHHVQSFVDQRSQHVLHLQIWSSKPVQFATRDPSSVEGVSSDRSTCAWRMSVVLDTPDCCSHLHNHIVESHSRILEEKLLVLESLLKS